MMAAGPNQTASLAKPSGSSPQPPSHFIIFIPRSTALMSSDQEKDEPLSLKAEYTSPNAIMIFKHPLPTTETTTTEGRTAYLSALRGSVTKLQEEINVFLTDKMEEDRALANIAGQKVDDKKEEENYGEEGAEDES